MGLFGVKRYDHEYDNGGKFRHYFSIVSPEDLSESKKLELPFEDDEFVDGGSCGNVLYFYGSKGKTVIFNLQNNERIIVPPPEVLSIREGSGRSFDPKSEEYTRRIGDRGKYVGCDEANYGGNEVFYPVKCGTYKGCGVSYDAKSGEYKVVRIYSQYLRHGAVGESEWEIKYYFDLYSVLSGAAKYISAPAWKLHISSGTSSIYVGEAGSGSGSCYWAAWPYLLSFDFATESFHQFPPPNPNSYEFKLVGCRGSVGVLVYWIPPDEFSLEPYKFSSDLYVQLFVRNGNGNGKGTSWDLLYDVTIADGKMPIGLKDDRCLFLAARPSDDGRSQVMVYHLASKTLKKLDIYNCSRNMSGICFGDKRRKKGKGK